MIATGLAFLPPMITFWFDKGPITILTGEQWIWVVGAMLALYKGANLIDKKISYGRSNPVADQTDDKRNKQ
jgi:hypothetical protein